MDIRAPDQQYNPYRVFSREQWARLRDDTPMTLEPGEFERLRSMHDRLDLKEVEEIYLPLSRLLSIYVDATQRLYYAQRQFLGIRRPQDALHHRRRRIGGGRQIDHRARAAGAAGALVAAAEGRSGDDRRLSVSQRGARAARPDAEEGLSGELRSADAAGVPERHQGRTAAGARAGLFAFDLRHHSEPMDRGRPAGHPDRRGRQCAADRPAAARRQGGAGGLGFLRFLGLYRRRRGRCCATGMSALPDAARHRVHTIRDPISTAMRCCRTRRPPPPRWRSGSAPTSPISRTISCRPGRARR